MKNVRTLLFIGLFTVLFGSFGICKAETLPNTIITTPQELYKYKGMSFDELKKVAKPMPESNVEINKYEFGTLNELKNYSSIPEDGNVYCIENKANKDTYTTFYKFLYAAPSAQKGCVIYYTYMWDFENEELQKCIGVKHENESNEELYNKLIAKEKAFEVLPNTLPPTQAELYKYKNMTLNDFKKVAKPMPENAIRIDKDKFGITKNIKDYLYIQGSNDIYYIENSLFGNKYIDYYKVLYVVPSDYGYVGYYTYGWSFVNGKKDIDCSCIGYGEEDEDNGKLHKQLKEEKQREGETGGSTSINLKSNKNNSPSPSSARKNSNNNSNYSSSNNICNSINAKGSATKVIIAEGFKPSAII
jgi:hypothetical protein